jgi:dihydropteroate synthase
MRSGSPIRSQFRPPLRCRGIDLPIGERTLIMGIVNVTPDSFSGDGLAAGGATDLDALAARARALVAAGADILDVGGESTRPGAEDVPVEEELARVVPAVERLVAAIGVPISIDTQKSAVARAALLAGAHVLNDITGLHGDPRLADLAAEFGAPVVAMHMKGRPRTMQISPRYTDLIGEIADYLRESVEIAVRAGVPRDQVVVDPGIGFGKSLENNLEIIRRLGEFRALGQPILIGASRKGFIGRILGDLPPTERVEGTVATTVLAIAQGADIVRVHDVRENARAARIADAVIREAGRPNADERRFDG